MTRLVAVLGYSESTTAGLHPVCTARLERAETQTRPHDVVLFSGSGRRGSPAEADLMAQCFAAPVRRRLVDRHSRTTLGNAIAVARATRRVGARDVVVVTSRWHARRAAVLVRAALLGSGAKLQVVPAQTRLTAARGIREAASWLVVPVLAVIAAGTR